MAFAGTNLATYFQKPDITLIGNQAIEGSMLERATAQAAGINALMNKDAADTALYDAKNQAKIIKAQGAQQASGMVQDGIVGFGSALGGAAISRWGKTPSTSSSSISLPSLSSAFDKYQFSTPSPGFSSFVGS